MQFIFRLWDLFYRVFEECLIYPNMVVLMLIVCSYPSKIIVNASMLVLSIQVLLKMQYLKIKTASTALTIIFDE